MELQKDLFPVKIIICNIGTFFFKYLKICIFSNSDLFVHLNQHKIIYRGIKHQILRNLSFW